MFLENVSHVSNSSIQSPSLVSNFPLQSGPLNLNASIFLKGCHMVFKDPLFVDEQINQLNLIIDVFTTTYLNKSFIIVMHSN